MENLWVLAIYLFSLGIGLVGTDKMLRLSHKKKEKLNNSDTPKLDSSASFFLSFYQY